MGDIQHSDNLANREGVLSLGFYYLGWRYVPAYSHNPHSIPSFPFFLAPLPQSLPPLVYIH